MNKLTLDLSRDPINLHDPPGKFLQWDHFNRTPYPPTTLVWGKVMRSRNRMRVCVLCSNVTPTPLVTLFFSPLSPFPRYSTCFCFHFNILPSPVCHKHQNQRYNIVEQEKQKGELNSPLKLVSLGGGTSMPHSGPGEFAFATNQSQSLNTPVTFCNFVKPSKGSKHALSRINYWNLPFWG